MILINKQPFLKNYIEYTALCPNCGDGATWRGSASGKGENPRLTLDVECSCVVVEAVA